MTTNAAAELAGVSIGTLYQYFSDKEMILDALADREVEIMSVRIRQIMADPALKSPEARVPAIVKAVATGYGERQGAHRIVMEHSLLHGGRRASPLLADLVDSLSHHGPIDTARQPLAGAEAFVLIYAFAGVLRAMTRQIDAPPRTEIEGGLVRLVTRFVR